MNGKGCEADGRTVPALRMRFILLLAVLFTTVSVVVLVHPVAFFEPDEFCYYFSSLNFMEGRLSLSAEELAVQRHQAMEMSPLWPHDLGYIAYKGRYVLVKAPGYSYYLALLRYLHIERLANVILAGASVMVLAWLGFCCFSKQVIVTSVFLLLLTPINLIMLYRVYMSDYAAAAFLFLGGTLVLIGNAETVPGRWSALIIDLLAGFLLGAAMVLRFTNGLTVMFLLGTHILFTLKPRPGSGREGDWFRPILLVAGFLVPLFGMFFYNEMVFGKMLASGYQLQTIRPQDTTFIFQQILRGYWLNVYGTVIRNLTVLPEILVSGLPWVILLPPALIWGYRNVERRIYILLTGWIVTVCLVYFQYRMLMPHIFVIISRMYLPLVGPAVILIALYLHRLHPRAHLIVCSFIFIISVMFFAFFSGRIDVPFMGAGPDTLFVPVKDVLGLFYENP